MWNDRSGWLRLARGSWNVEQTPAVRTARILVIEDNVSDVFLLDRALKKQDFPFELIHLLDGGAALAFIRRQAPYADAPIPDLILMDLNLSKYTGEEILREIRTAKHLEGVPVCAWSSSQSWRDKSHLMELGVERFITKPSGLDQFMEIGAILKGMLAGRTLA
jgi:DNA-binding response OmpR family regulator